MILVNRERIMKDSQEPSWQEFRDFIIRTHRDLHETWGGLCYDMEGLRDELTNRHVFMS